jgi:hypothetical protein
VRPLVLDVQERLVEAGVGPGAGARKAGGNGQSGKQGTVRLGNAA